MDRGFNLNIDAQSFASNSVAVADYKSQNKRDIESLAQLMLDKDTVGAELVIEALFPTVSADIFLSHSHADQDLAISLAIELERKCGLKVFIDSCVWGAAHDLLQVIDDKYCKSPGEINYSYAERNRSTAHVHMILSTALQRMIDNTDTLFFLNTEQSISLKHSVDGSKKTLSPWIHMELEFSSMVRRQRRRHMTKSHDGRMFDSIGTESYNVAHEAPIRHLVNLAQPEFMMWLEATSRIGAADGINLLYELEGA
ncbi:toll/interleukin-1 receptor domain-containing protein [Pseudomonas silvicola]|nr:toll/interleukin-1 receptor domain-containing protein [Pseudomonas silvicola]